MFDQFFALNSRLGPPRSGRSRNVAKKRSNRSQTSLQRWRDIMIQTARVFSTHQGLLGSLSCTRVLIELASNGGSGEKCRKVSEILIFLLDSLLNSLLHLVLRLAHKSTQALH